MIAVVLPAYNEEDTIVPLIEGIQRIGKKRLLEEVVVIVVDDGSSDEKPKCAGRRISKARFESKHYEFKRK